MKIGSALAIYALFWVMSLFLVLPFGVRTAEEAGVERLPGHAESAPHNFSFVRTALERRSCPRSCSAFST
jgi:predicted secreted protein